MAWCVVALLYALFIYYEAFSIYYFSLLSPRVNGVRWDGRWEATGKGKGNESGEEVILPTYSTYPYEAHNGELFSPPPSF